MKAKPEKINREKKLKKTRVIWGGVIIFLFAAVSIFYFTPQRSESFASFESPPPAAREKEPGVEKEEFESAGEKDESYDKNKEKRENSSQGNLKDPFEPDPLIAEYEPEPQPDPDEDPEAVPDPEAEPEEFTTYTVKSCDTLYGISRHFGVPVEVIAADNDIKDKDIIYAGQELVIRLGEENDEIWDKPEDIPVTK